MICANDARIRTFAVALLLAAMAPATLAAAEEPLPSKPAAAQPAQDAGNAMVLGPQPFAPTRKVGLSLNECVLRTLRQGEGQGNYQLQITRLEPEISRTQVREAEAAFDPTLTMSTFFSDLSARSSSALMGAGVSRTNAFSWEAALSKTFKTGTVASFTYTGARTGQNNSFLSLNPNHELDLTLALTQPLLRNAGVAVNTANIRIAENTSARSVQDLVAAQLAVVRGVHEAYWNLVFAIENLEVRNKSLALAARTLEDNRKREKVGHIPHLEVVGAEADVGRRREEINLAEATIAQASDALRNLINDVADNLQDNTQIVPEDRAVMIQVEVNEFNAVREALMYRPDLKQAHIDVSSAGIALEVTKNALLPNVDVSMTYTRNGLARHFRESLEDAVEHGQTRDLQAGISVTIPLGFNAERSVHTRRQLDKTQLILTLKNTERTVVVDVRDAVRSVWTAKSSVRRAEQDRIFREKNVISEQRKFEVGKKTSLDVLQAQDDLSRAESAELAAIVEYMITLVRLEETKGTLLKSSGITIGSDDEVP